MTVFSIELSDKCKLTGSNFEQWKLQIKSILQLKHLYRLVTRKESIEEAKLLNKKDPNRHADAMAILTLNCDVEIVAQFASKVDDDPCVFWELLEQLFQRKTQLKSTYLNDTFRIVLRSETLKADLNHIHEKAQQLCDLFECTNAEPSVLIDTIIAMWTIVNLPNDVKVAGDLPIKSCARENKTPTMKQTIQEICQYLEKHNNSQESYINEPTAVSQKTSEPTLDENQTLQGLPQSLSGHTDKRENDQLDRMQVSVEAEQNLHDDLTTTPSNLENSTLDSENVTEISKGSLLPSKKVTSPEKDNHVSRILPPKQKISIEKDEDGSQSVVAPHPSYRIHDLSTSKLSTDQAQVFQRVLDGRSVFFTGSAGTGKSHLLKVIAKHLREDLKKEVYVTASTTIAASLIKGTTIQCFSGFGSEKKHTSSWAYELRNTMAEQRWKSAEVLIIDEVSMIYVTFFEKLDEAAKYLRDSKLPFGGIQLILAGDFFQLPPLHKKFIFDSRIWHKYVTETLVLKHAFRQSDQALVDMLDDIRSGHMSKHTKQVMKLLKKHLDYPDGIQLVDIFSSQDSAETFNMRCLERLDSPIVIFKSTDGQENSSDTSSLRQQLDTLVPEYLIFMVGAQVILVKDLPDDGLLQGSIGIITGFVNTKELGTCEEGSPRFDLSKFENDHKSWPKVLFTNGKTKVLTPNNFGVEGPSGRVEVTRVQVPLILAWAVSIYQCQGLSLDRIRVSIYDFEHEPGQLYFALSRATSLHHIRIVPRYDQEDYIPFIPDRSVLAWAKNYL